MEIILIIIVIAFLLFTVGEFAAFLTLLFTGLYVIVKTFFFNDRNKSDSDSTSDSSTKPQ